MNTLKSIKTKAALALVFAVLLILGCGAEEENQLGIVSEKLDKLVEAFEKTDIDAHSGLWAQDDSLTVYGLYRGNNFNGWEELRNHFEKASQNISESRIEVLKKTVSISHDRKTAWFSMLCNQFVKMKNSERELSGMRYTGVMEKIGGQWRIVQFHGSVPLNISI